MKPQKAAIFSYSGQNAASELPENRVFATMNFFLGGMDIIFSPKEPIIFIKNMTAILKTGCIVIWRCTYDDYRNDTICATKL